SGELVATNASPRDRGVIVDVHEAEEDTSRQRLLAICQGAEGALRGLADGVGDATGLQIVVERQPAPAGTAIGLEKRMREKRQRARIVKPGRGRARDELAEEQLYEIGFNHRAGMLRRLDDGAPQFLRRHRADNHLMAL